MTTAAAWSSPIVGLIDAGSGDCAEDELSPSTRSDSTLLAHKACTVTNTATRAKLLTALLQI